MNCLIHVPDSEKGSTSLFHEILFMRSSLFLQTWSAHHPMCKGFYPLGEKIQFCESVSTICTKLITVENIDILFIETYHKLYHLIRRHPLFCFEDLVFWRETPHCFVIADERACLIWLTWALPLVWGSKRQSVVFFEEFIATGKVKPSDILIFFLLMIGLNFLHPLPQHSRYKCTQRSRII